jgi:hypothetical protein
MSWPFSASNIFAPKDVKGRLRFKLLFKWMIEMKNEPRFLDLFQNNRKANISETELENLGLDWSTVNELSQVYKDYTEHVEELEESEEEEEEEEDPDFEDGEEEYDDDDEYDESDDEYESEEEESEEERPVKKQRK